MSDRSYFQIQFYAAPEDPEIRGQALAILQGEGCDLDEEDLDEEVLHLGQMYSADECTLGTYESMSNDLIELHPGFSFVCWNDPKYEYPGGIAMYTPDLGLFLGDCDAEGNVTLRDFEIQKLCADNAAERLERVRLGLHAKHAPVGLSFDEFRDGACSYESCVELRGILAALAAQLSAAGLPWSWALGRATKPAARG